MQWIKGIKEIFTGFPPDKTTFSVVKVDKQKRKTRLPFVMKPAASDETKLDEKYRIPYGKEFIVKEINKGFARIKYKKKDCWVDMHYFRSYADHAKHWIVDNQSKDYVWLRGEKKLHSKKKLTKMWNGTYITVSEIDHGWGKVSYDGKTGWVDLKSCKPTAED